MRRPAGTDLEYMGAYVVARWNADAARVITLGMRPRPGITAPPAGWAILCHGATRKHAAERMRETARELLTAAELMEDDSVDDGVEPLNRAGGERQ
jgi:hypothetical protein